MPSTLSPAALNTERQSLPAPSGSVAKASLDPKVPVTQFRDLAADALVDVAGSQKNAALDLELSEGRLSAKIKDGTLRICDLEQFGPDYAARFGEALVKRYGATDPKARLRQEIRELRAKADRVAALAEEIAS